MAPPSAPLVTVDIAAGVATLTLSSPPVNALQPTLLESLFVQLRKAQSNPDVKAILLTGAGGRFCAGFDFTLFGTPVMERLFAERQEVLAQFTALLENGVKPTVAAIEGVALGGGCELALACNARVCAAGAQVGLPEVRLGLLPGLGGTQRLPRLVGVEQALNLMLSGQPISSEDAQAVGLVDEVVPAAELLPAARRLALELAAGKAARRCTLQLTTHMQSTGEEFESSVSMLMTAKANVSKRFAGQQHFVYLLEAVAAGLASGPAVGLQKEGEGFRAAASSLLHRMMLHMFKLDRWLKKARGPVWVLGQVCGMLALLVLVVYVKLLVPYSFAVRLRSSFKKGFSQGYKAKKGDKMDEDDAAAAAAPASGSGRQEPARRRKGK